MKVLSMNPPSMFPDSDVVAWRHTNDDLFTVKSAYSNVVNMQFGNVLWKDFWRWKSSAKIQTCMWLIGHVSLPVNDTLASRDILTSNLCPFDSSRWADFNSVNLHNWLDKNVKGSFNLRCCHDILWKDVFFMFLKMRILPHSKCFLKALN